MRYSGIGRKGWSVVEEVGGWNWGARGDEAVVMVKVKWGRVVERFFEWIECEGLVGAET